jgi:hypothetical protein
MGWKPIGWTKYPKAYFSPRSGTLQQQIVKDIAETRCISPSPRRSTWILDVGPILVMMSSSRALRNYGLMDTWGIDDGWHGFE